MTPRFFRSAAEFRRWLEERHGDAEELWVGFHKRASGREGLTHSAAVDEALCFGWIDGVRKSLDEASYTIRFTRRRPGSIWSVVNLRRVGELIATGRMRPAGRAVYERRDEKRTRRYSFENKDHTLAPADEKRLRASRTAWAFWEKQAAWYRRAAAWWVSSAVRTETRERRLKMLVECSARGDRLPHLDRSAKRT